MAVFEWNGLVRITVGEISRAGQLDLWVMYSESEWHEKKTLTGVDYTRQLTETDAMVAAAATRKIEVCKGGKWVTLNPDDKHTVITPDGDSFELSYPVPYATINTCPRSLGDQWIEASVERNGGFNHNMTFFSSLTLTNGKTNSEPKSEEPPSNTPAAVTS